MCINLIKSNIFNKNNIPRKSMTREICKKINFFGSLLFLYSVELRAKFIAAIEIKKKITSYPLMFSKFLPNKNNSIEKNDITNKPFKSALLSRL